MYSDKLSPPIDITGMTNHSDIENALYSVFQSKIMDRENRSKFQGKFIYVDCNSWIKNKNEMFWHLISLNEEEKFNVFPCNNCVSATKCFSNCTTNARSIHMKNDDIRNICYYRGIRVHWINEIVHLANNGDPDVRIWRVTKKRGRKQTYIRFINGAVDYIIVLDERFKAGELSNYILTTAYPVFYINAKDNFDKAYSKYIQILSAKK
ncbi:hypothetical protein [Bacillus amyloliquefaciens]|uniref:hypothetical protein n=1 Tax=Bacillus amyloliquefaciens TaxID=1390 RepID=UPI0007A5C0D8|nr:hypothetical protein [Bacillus amyloliquefaciens]